MAKTLTDAEIEKIRQITQLHSSMGLRQQPSGAHWHQGVSTSSLPPYSGYNFPPMPRIPKSSLKNVSDFLEANSDLITSSSISVDAAQSSSTVELKATFDNFVALLTRISLSSETSYDDAVENVTNQCVEMEVSSDFTKGALAALEIILNHKHLEDLL